MSNQSAIALDRRGWIELGAALATAGVHVLPLERLYPEVLEIVLMVVGWGLYLAWTFVRHREEVHAMGWTRRRVGPASLASFAVLASGTLAAAIVGAEHERLALHGHMIPLALLYPVYGLFQQGLVLGVVARRLDSVMAGRPVITVVATALVFAAVHAPDTLLVIGTCVLGLILTPIYLRWRNLWPLGFVHGWLAIPVYFWVVGNDPWAAVTQVPR